VSTPQEATLDCPDYAIIAMVQGSLGEPGIVLGTKGGCRFCGQTDPRAFRNVAHTLPEAFGNKWVRSLDECATPAIRGSVRSTMRWSRAWAQS
jgi:hypothetical protein